MGTKIDPSRERHGPWHSRKFIQGKCKSMFLCFAISTYAVMNCVPTDPPIPGKSTDQTKEEALRKLLIGATVFAPRNMDAEGVAVETEFGAIRSKLDECELVALRYGGTSFLVQKEFCGNASSSIKGMQSEIITATMTSFSGTRMSSGQPVLNVVELNPDQICIADNVDVQTGAGQPIILPAALTYDTSLSGMALVMNLITNLWVVLLTNFATGMDHVWDVLNNMYLADPVYKLEKYKLCYAFSTKKIDLTLRPAFEAKLRSTYEFRQNDRSETLTETPVRLFGDIKIEGEIDSTGALIYTKTSGDIHSDIGRVQVHQEDFFSWAVVWFGITISRGRVQTVDNSLFLWPVVSGTISHDAGGDLKLHVHWQSDYECKLSGGRHGLADGDFDLIFNP